MSTARPGSKRHSGSELTDLVNTEKKPKLYKVEVGWTVVKIRKRRQIRRGNLGAWNFEHILVVAKSEEMAKAIATIHYIDKGFETTPHHNKMTSRKEVEIFDITRIA